MLLLSLHACNVDTLQRYNIAIINPGNAAKGLEEKFTCVQRAFWFDTRKKRAQGMSHGLTKSGCQIRHFEGRGL